MKLASRIGLLCIGVVGVLVVLSGCAGYRIELDGKRKGYDVYQPEPYLQVQYNDKGSTGQIIWLPNYKKRYRISTWNLLAKADFSFTIQDGWMLTNISDKSDNTSGLPKLLEMVGPLVSGLTAGHPEPGASTPDVRLFRLVFCKETGVLKKLEEVPIPWNVN